MGLTIALRGKGSSGKTHTIGFLHELLVANNYAVIHSSFASQRDFISVFEKKGKRIGVTSRGDAYEYVRVDLERIIEHHSCEIAVCACHTTDRRNKNGIVRGTNAAVRSFPGYSPFFIEKQVSGDVQQYDALNREDADRLFQQISQSI